MNKPILEVVQPTRDGSLGSSLRVTRSAFNAERLTLARELQGLTKAKMASLLELTPATITGWEKGSIKPAQSSIAKAALVLGVSADFFYGPRVPEVSDPYFRSLRSTPKYLRDQARAYVKTIAMVLATIEGKLSLPKPNLPSFPIDDDEKEYSPERVAHLVRAHFGVPSGPISNMVRLLERNGIVVSYGVFGDKVIDAYSSTVDDCDRSIVVITASKGDYYRRRFDVAHELGHLVMHAENYDDGQRMEEQADRFASEFLAPIGQIRSQLPTKIGRVGWQQLRQVKEQWGISMAALLYKSRQYGHIDYSTYKSAQVRISQLGWRTNEPGDVQGFEEPLLMPQVRERLMEKPFGLEEVVADGNLLMDKLLNATARSAELLGK